MPEPRTMAQVRSEIEAQRNELAASVDALRGEIEEATDIAGKLSARLPLVTVAALGAGFVLAGGVGATMRFLARTSREGEEQARAGRFALVRR
jgi:hypothetical protein